MASFLDIPGLPLGLRNNNPGNLRPLPGGQKWEGEIARDAVNNFSRFSNIEYGLRAMITDITGDIVLDKLNSIRRLVMEYAPPGDNNNTQAYINSVAASMGISPDALLQANRDTIERLIKAKLRVELGPGNAGKISQESINQAFNLLSNNAKSWFSGPVATGSGLVLLLLIGWVAAKKLK